MELAKNHSSFGVLSCLLAAILFGASTPVAKALLSTVPPLTLAGLFYLGAAVAVLPFSFRGGSASLRREPRQRWLMGLAVVFGGAIGPVLLLLGLRSAPAASVALWLNIETVATALLAWILFQEHLDRRTWIAAGLVLLAGIVLAAPEGVAGLRSAGLVTLACLCWGLDNNLTSQVGGFTPAQMTVIKGFVAGSVNLALGIVIEASAPGARALGAALAVGALSYGISIMLYISGAQQLGATRSQLIFSTSPFIGVVFAWTLLKEPIQLTQITAAGLMLAGLHLMLTARHAHEHAHATMFHTHSHRHDDGHHDHSHPGLSASARHTHPHEHQPKPHTHPHAPDLHHRHEH